MLLQIPDTPWNSIGVDFIINLTLSNKAKAMIVVVDRFTKWA